jgi:hypothetical protein
MLQGREGLEGRIFKEKERGYESGGVVIGDRRVYGWFCRKKVHHVTGPLLAEA